MSHFTALVVAKDEQELEAKLLPYHEYECTGIEQYIVFEEEDTEELQRKFEAHKEDREEDGKEGYPDLETYAREWHGYTQNEEGKYGRWTNPNARWDWWVVGGRWPEVLLLMDGSRGSTALVEDIDWWGLIEEKSENAKKRWNNWRTLPPIEEDREAHRKAAFDKGFFLTPPSEAEDLTNLTEEAYAKKYGRDDALTFALVNGEGEWLESGRMGWWAMVSDEQPDYDKKFWETVKALEPSQRVFVIDCHI